MKKRPHNQGLSVLVFSAVYFPGFKGGGPVKTIKNLFNQVGKEISFRLVTSDRDLGDKEPYTSVACGQWNDIGNAAVFYAQPGRGGYSQIMRIIKSKNYHIIYLNSFFSPRFSFFPLFLARVLQQRVVLSPRGEFSKGALAIKPSKKKIFIVAYKILQLHRHVIFQASSQFEELDIRRVLGEKVDVRVAENIAAQEFGDAAHERIVGNLRVIFVGRISPMKNLLMALESLRNVHAQMAFDIYGPLEDSNYWLQCQEVIETLPKHIQVSYKGFLDPLDVVKTMSGYDVFYLPTKGENYGHAIVEATCAGLPIIISDTTPWRNLQDCGIGWDLSLSAPEYFGAALDELAAMPSKEYQEMRQRVLSWANEKFSQRNAVEANIALFKYAYEKQ
ncbi:glycosyltransferase family 4 protein [Vreelandella profundi]|uniref:glycosyltransferase family 4 protein n=1 Tax=Vreelandella profundi TaxID=2852117 RepID=UPI001F3AB28E|nr:glycosyltransferase [Halomonas profundi]